MKHKMERIDKIWNHKLYQECRNQIEAAEENRIYCLHNLEHSLDVARIAYIMNLEEQYHLERELIYAIALLHDCDFSEDEIRIAGQAIGAHQSSQHDSELDNLYATVLYQADKLSRNCYECKARKTCYWEENKKNKAILY
jgi:HD superfamily phosphodiesterase